jgi:hypothetical protein
MDPVDSENYFPGENEQKKEIVNDTDGRQDSTDLIINKSSDELWPRTFMFLNNINIYMFHDQFVVRSSPNK